MVPKIPKLPIEMRMLTYYNETNEQSNNISKISNFSSRGESANESSFLRRKASADSLINESIVHQLRTDNVYKPFKKETKHKKESHITQENDNFDLDENDDQITDNNNKEEDKSNNYNSFFMTQVSLFN